MGDGGVIIDGDGGGSITVKDSTNTTFIDPTGLVSTANFTTTGTNSDVLNQTLSVDADITGSSSTFNVTRSSVVLFFFHTSCRVVNSPSDGCSFVVGFYLDSLQKEAIDYQTVLDSDNRLQSASNFFFSTNYRRSCEKIFRISL